jgi:hemerythrin-like domain-containing protein
MSNSIDRRSWIAISGAGILGLTVRRSSAEEHEGGGPEVPAAEDLMREHGVLRRALLVYSEAASRLATGKDSIPIDALGRAAALFRSFGEDYHERSLEEKHVFPPLVKIGGHDASLARTLTAQHERGRQITDYISRIAKQGNVPSAQARPFADTLVRFVRMYEHHAAIEDTIIFPAWKRAISSAEYRELTEQFEELEHRMFGEDGYEDALERISAIEDAFGLSDLAKFTPPPPPGIA